MNNEITERAIKLAQQKTEDDKQLSRLEAELSAEREKTQQLQNANNEMNALATKSSQQKAEDGKQLSKLEADLSAEREKSKWLQTTNDNMKAQFASLASESLRQTSHDFLIRADGTLTQQRDELNKSLQPLKEQVDMLGKAVQEIEVKREGAYADLNRQVGNLSITHQQLQVSTNELSLAMKSSSARGQWGELQLRRIVELSGMKPYVDYDEQVGLEDGGRPDMIIHLPNLGMLAVDSKAPMKAYLEALSATSDPERKSKLRDHSRHVKGHINILIKRDYASQLKNSPAFVVMFMPNESCMSAAFEYDPELLDFALSNNILITTPITLIALLKSTAYGWQQQDLAQNANQIAEKGRELFDRLNKFVEHLSKLRKNLSQTVENFNGAIGSLEGRVLPSARDLGRLTTASKEIELFEPMDSTIRSTSFLD